MANVCLLMVGGIIALIGGIIMLINSSVYSSNQGMIKEIDRTLSVIRNTNDWNKTRDGALVFVNAKYDTSQKAYDRDFETEFSQETIIKRRVERYGYYSVRRLLNQISPIQIFSEEEEKDEEIPEEKEGLKYLEEEKNQEEKNSSNSLRNLKSSKSKSWHIISSYSNNMVASRILKLTSIQGVQIDSKNIIDNGMDFIQKDLTQENIDRAKPYISAGSYFSEKKYKRLYSGLLYYASSSWSNSKEDLRITYYKFPSDQYIAIIGEKRGNTIVPKRDLKGYENYQVFKAAGKDYTDKEFIKYMKDSGHGVYIFFLVFSIIILIIGGILLMCGIFAK